MPVPSTTSASLPGAQYSGIGRLERILGYMIVGMVVVTVIALFAILAGAYFDNSGEFDRGLWPVIALVPLIALPLAVVLTLTLVVVGARRRSAEAAIVRSEQERASNRRAAKKNKGSRRPSGTRGPRAE